jgi:hypothetical protein
MMIVQEEKAHHDRFFLASIAWRVCELWNEEEDEGSSSLSLRSDRSKISSSLMVP